MTIRTRLIALFNVIVSGLLLLFCLLIYFFAERYRMQEFQQRLEAEARTSVELLFGKETISLELFKLLDKNQLTVLYREEIIIYNYQNQIVYESGTDYLSVSAHVLNQIRMEKKMYWRKNSREMVGIYYTNPRTSFVVIASAEDRYGFSKVRHTAFILSVGWLVMSVCVFAAGWFYTSRVLYPLKRLLAGMDAITASRLNVRLPEQRSQDELTQLSHRFNRMLDRLEEAFQAQRSFVSHASHELRTPLAAIIGQIQVALLARDDATQLCLMLESILDDAQEIRRLLNGLLMLASLNTEEFAQGIAPVSLDELLWQARSELIRTQPAYQVHILLEENASSESYQLQASEILLYTAVLNLMENGCKFSPEQQVAIHLSRQGQTFVLSFHNTGSYIPTAELPDIFKPFYRGSNSHQIAGHGIGLSLTDRIIHLHRGRLVVTSDIDTGTTFTITLPF